MQLENLLTRAIAATAVKNFAGTWKNELGSIANFSQNGSSIHGNYTSIVNEGGKAFAEGPLVGWANGNLISFTVDFGDFDSLSSWVGTFVLGGNGTSNRIETLWYLDSAVAPGAEWESVQAGADTFWRV